ncbi:MAG: radical SAM protein [Candidatus Lokiarchaeota archaeon]|nr:radical SAM protein [Candidatus Lokiarchaeota archaeon]
MRILYVNPARIESGLDAIIKGPPMSLISIAAMVPEHDAKLFDFKIHKFKENQFRRELNHSDIIAITSMTPQISHALEIAEKAKNQGLITIIGGYHPTLAPDYVAKHPYVDYIVRGEGEHTFKELIDYIDGNKNQMELKDIKGISFLDSNNHIHHNAERPLELNLDNFPMPRRDLLDDKKYIYLGARVAQLETSRGCPHSCKFCCIVKMWKDHKQHIVYRSKSISRIIKEIYDVNLKNDFIFFCEDNFTIQVKRTKKILETIIRSGIQNKFYFSAQSRVDTLYRNPWIIDLMHKAGMRQIFLGIETVHKQSLKAMNKGNLTPEMTRKVVSMLHDRGISIFGGIIIGFPGETKTMVRQTIQFARSLDLTCMQFTPITAFPGTEFFQEMKDADMITSNNYKHYDLFHPMMRTSELSSREIYRLVGEAYASTYLDRDWLITQGKRFLNPFGKFSWMFKNIFKLMKGVVRNGLEMLHSQGISNDVISDELKNLMKNGLPHDLNLKSKVKEEPFLLTLKLPNKKKIKEISEIF